MISLLWHDQPRRDRAATVTWEEDLELPPLVRALSHAGRYAAQVRAVLTDLCQDPTIIVYRQAVLEDLLRLPPLAARLEIILPSLANLAYGSVSQWDDSGVFQVATRLGELELYVECVQQLLAALDEMAPELTAVGWIGLRKALHALATTADFQALAAELPTLRTQMEQANSVTLGINLNAQLQPESATLLAVHAERFEGPRSLLGRLFKGEPEVRHGLTPLRQASDHQPLQPGRQLFRDLSSLLEEVTAPVARTLSRYTHVHSRELIRLDGELAFYLGAVRLIQSLQAQGYALCRPQVVPMDARVCEVSDTYNVSLVLRLQDHSPQTEAPPAIVPSDATFDDAGRMFVLTGPNRGGKTTFTRAVGQVQVLAQAGLYVPGTAARLSPVDAIFTLFPEAEHAQTGMGRLDEEAARLAVIFQQATDHSLVLLNEPLASTSPAEAMGIARDVLCGLRLLGARGIIVTHLHDLAQAVEALNAAVSGRSRLASLVAEIDAGANNAEHARRTYRIRAGVPRGRSYAADVAVQHGLHLNQITQTLQARGVDQAEHPEV